MEDDNLEDNLENESDLQEQLLQQLAKYGDSLLDNDAPVKYTGKVKHEPAKSGQPAISFTDKLTAENKLSTKVSSPQKKRKRTSGSKTSEKHVDKDATNATIKPGLRGEQRHVKELRLTLGLTDEEIERLKSQGKEKDGATRHDATKKGKAAPEIVVFDDPAKRKKKRKASTPQLLLFTNFTWCILSPFSYWELLCNMCNDLTFYLYRKSQIRLLREMTK